MDRHTLRVLEFNKILRMAAESAATVPGRSIVENIQPLGDIDEITNSVHLISEWRKLFSEEKQTGIEHFGDLAPFFKKIRPDDSVLDPFELRSFLPLFISAINLKTLERDPVCQGLGRVLAGMITHSDILQTINSSMDNEGNILDRASARLASIRKGLKTCIRKIRGTLEGLLNRKDLMPHLQDFYLAERNNRWVIPVKSDFRGSVPGIIHDISNTGETVYIEPYEIQQIGNELESFRAEEKLEEYRILQRISSDLRENRKEIENDYNIVARVDALAATARFADRYNMAPPEINDRGCLKIVRGRHPVLCKTLEKANRPEEIVPLDMELGSENMCMVVTGSNAGGKTVALKTAGVLTLMALSGMHTPSESGSTYPLLENILADIGDEQSIEQNLSTFTAHITRIADIVRRSSKRTLIIIDELGTGTDPEQGGALSCAILRRLKSMGSLSIISTHLGLLKSFAHSEPGIINSAMEMREIRVNGASTFNPTYRLLMGELGTSHAFEIAESLGLPKDLIREARGFVQDSGSETDSLITELKQKKADINRKLEETAKLRKEADSVRLILEEEKQSLENSEREIMSKALKEAEDIMRITKRDARRMIDDIKKSTASRGREMIKDIDARIDELKKDHERLSPVNAESVRAVKEGDSVFIGTIAKNGTVKSVNKKKGTCMVVVDDKDVTASLTDLFAPLDDKVPEADSPRGEIKSIKVPDRDEYTDVFPELNLVGKRVDPALSLVERHLNDASMAGLGKIRIIHGIGEGKLSHAIRDFLSDHPLVEKYRKGNDDEGGEAVTIAFLH